jgi:tetratricopeptide (TPR) repeat protein
LDLNEAVALHREAIGLWPALHPHRSGSLDNLANTLSQQFSQTGQIGDLDEAIELHRKALELRPAPHSRRSDSLHNLASDLGKRYSQTHQLPDIEEAIMLLRDSLSMLPQGHPKNCTTSHQLGMFFMHMHSQTQKPEYLEDAMAMFRAAVCCVTAPASKRFEASQTWAHYADSVNHDSALEAYQAAIQLLPRLATLGLDLLSRHKALTAGSDGLARSAAACAIRYGQFDKAVELLEEGRSIFWSQASQLRVPLDDLQLTAPEAVQKLKRISRALEQGSLRDSARSVSDTSQQVMSMEQETARYRRLNDDWLTTLEEVRSLDGFGDFLRPKPLTTLLRVAANDPVVILIASDSSCAALILTSSGVRHFPLPKFTLMIAQGLVALIRSATQSGASDHLLSEAVHMQVEALTQHAWTHESDVIPTEPRHGKLHSAFSMDADSIFSLVLQTLWKSLVEPVIRSLSLEVS